MRCIALYRNKHDETFEDLALPEGIGKATELMSGWSVKFIDYDNDGKLDLFIVNGHPNDIIEEIKPNVTFKEPLLLFRNTGKAFQDISGQSGPLFARQLSARGMAIGDFNNDGAVDILISVNDGAPILLRNDAAKQNHWLGVNLVGTKSNRDAVGARVTYQAADLKGNRMKVGGSGFLSSHDPRLVLGIGERTKFDWLEVKWPLPSKAVQRIINPPIDRYITIVEGESKWK